MLANEPARERHIHPKYNNLPINQLLKEWEEKGLEAAADLLSSILVDETFSSNGDRKEPALPKLGKKKRKKKRKRKLARSTGTTARQARRSAWLFAAFFLKNSCLTLWNG